jgi:hypothetical protein
MVRVPSIKVADISDGVGEPISHGKLPDDVAQSKLKIKTKYNFFIESITDI